MQLLKEKFQTANTGEFLLKTTVENFVHDEIENLGWETEKNRFLQKFSFDTNAINNIFDFEGDIKTINENAYLGIENVERVIMGNIKFGEQSLEILKLKKSIANIATEVFDISAKFEEYGSIEFINSISIFKDNLESLDLPDFSSVKLMSLQLNSNSIEKNEISDLLMGVYTKFEDHQTNKISVWHDKFIAKTNQLILLEASAEIQYQTVLKNLAGQMTTIKDKIMANFFTVSFACDDYSHTFENGWGGINAEGIYIELQHFEHFAVDSDWLTEIELSVKTSSGNLIAVFDQIEILSSLAINEDIKKIISGHLVWDSVILSKLLRSKIGSFFIGIL